MDKDTQLRFLHIPKTAGSSFNECLFALYFKAYFFRRLFIFSGNIRADVDRFQHLDKSFKRRVILFSGHSPYKTGISDIDDVNTITFLRNPVDRVVSLCQHFSEGKSPTIRIDRSNTNGSIDSFINSGRTQLANFQTKILLGEGRYALPKGSVNEIADQALDILENRLCAFGITEEFDLSLLLFHRALNWKSRPVYRIRNVKSDRNQIYLSEHQIEKIAELNQIDRVVYEKASSLFYARAKPFMDDPATESSRLRRQLTRRSLKFSAIDLSRALARLKNN